MRAGGWMFVASLLAASCTSLRTGSPDQGSGGAGGGGAGAGGNGATGAAGTGVGGTTAAGGGGANGGAIAGTGGGPGGAAGGTAGTSGTAGRGGAAGTSAAAGRGGAAGTSAAAGTSGTAGAGGTDPDLIAFWRFNEGSGTTIADSSGNGQTLTLQGGTWTVGHDGSSVAFDGASELANITPASGQPLLDFPQKEVTISAWIKPTAAAASRPFATAVARTHDDFAFQDFWLGLASGKPACSIHSPTQEIAAAGSVASTTTWTHIACTQDDGGDVHTFVNGTEVGTVFSGNALGPIDTPILVGASETMQPTQRAQFFPGAIDDVRIYKRALTALEIASIAN